MVRAKRQQQDEGDRHAEHDEKEGAHGKTCGLIDRYLANARGPRLVAMRRIPRAPMH